MGILLFFLKIWLMPIATIVLIYALFLVPVYVLSKKRKLTYCSMILLVISMIYLVDLGFFIFLIKIEFNNFTAGLFLFTILVNFIVFIFVPFSIKKIIKLKLNKKQFYGSYLIIFLLQFLYVYLIAFWMAAGVGKFFMTLG